MSLIVILFLHPNEKDSDIARISDVLENSNLVIKESYFSYISKPLMF